MIPHDPLREALEKMIALYDKGEPCSTQLSLAIARVREAHAALAREPVSWQEQRDSVVALVKKYQWDSCENEAEAVEIAQEIIALLKASQPRALVDEVLEVELTGMNWSAKEQKGKPYKVRIGGFDASILPLKAGDPVRVVVYEGNHESK